jgi:hypothetical protein
MRTSLLRAKAPSTSKPVPNRASEMLTQKTGFSITQAFALAYIGYLREARTMSQRAADFAEQTAHSERAALTETGVAVREARIF